MTAPSEIPRADEAGEPMNLCERIRCALALHDAGYTFTPDPSDVAELLGEYEVLAVPRPPLGGEAK